MKQFIEGKYYTIDKEAKGFKVGDYLAQMTVGLFKDKITGDYKIPPQWHVIQVETEQMAKFYRLVSYTHKITDFEDVNNKIVEL